MPDIYLRQGAVTPADVLLRDPTQADTGAINASIAESQAAQTEAIVAAETYSAAVSESQSSQSEAIVVAEKYSAAIAESQAIQTESITASEKYSAALAETQASQTEAIVVAETYSATLAESQSAQSEAITGTVVTGVITADIAEVQSAQSEAVIGTVTVPIPVPPPFIGGGYGGLMPGFWIDKLSPELRRKRKPRRRPVLTPERVKVDLSRLAAIFQESGKTYPDEALASLHKILRNVKSLPPLTTTISRSPEEIALELQKARIKQEDEQLIDLILTEVA